MEKQNTYNKEQLKVEDIYSFKESNNEFEIPNEKDNITNLQPKILERAITSPYKKQSNKDKEINYTEDVIVQINDVKNKDINDNQSPIYIDNEKRTLINHKFVEDNVSRTDKSHILKKFESKRITNDETPDSKRNSKYEIIFQKDPNEIKFEKDINEEAKEKDGFANIRISDLKQELPNSNFLKQDLEKEIYFFFVNPKSGSKEGSLLLNTSLRKVEFNIQKKYLCFIFSLIDDTLNEGIELLKELLSLLKNRDSFPRVIIGGGDGTTMSFLETLLSKGIDVQRCYYGILPLGTGNDLSNALGFGSKVDIDSDMIKFKNIVLDFSRSNARNIDIWKLKLSVEEDGGIFEIKKNDTGFGKEAIKDTKTNKKTIKLEKGFINYFSFGYDARVGYGFDKNRTSFRCCNKFVYFWEGLKKTCWRKTLTVPGFLKSFQIVKNEDNENIKDLNITDIENFNDKRKEFFRGKKTENLNKSETKDSKMSHCENIVLKGNPVSIVCQNINFYMGGTGDIWTKSGQNLGLELESIPSKTNTNLNLNKEADLEFRKILEGEQKFDDGKLEFLTYQKEIYIGLEKISSGNAEKVYHGKGPIIMEFNKIPIETEDKLNRVYMNIDGEYFNVVKPTELRVREHKDFPQGKIKFLSKI